MVEVSCECKRAGQLRLSGINPHIRKFTHLHITFTPCQQKTFSLQVERAFLEVILKKYWRRKIIALLFCREVE